MASRLKQIHNEVLELIKSMSFPNRSDKAFKYTNIWDNQVVEVLEQINDSYSFRFPAIFFELDLGEARQLGGGFRSYPNCVFRYHICHELLDSQNGYMEQNLGVIDYRDLTISKVQNSSISFCSSMQSFEDKMDYKHKNVYRWVLGFKCNFIDDAGSDFDPNNGTTWGYLENPTLNINVFFSWVSGREYESNMTSSLKFYVTQGGLKFVASNGAYYITSDSEGASGNYANVVSYKGDVYICKQTNSDVEFDITKWEKIESWTPRSFIKDEITAFYSGIYICLNPNNDAIFNETNWNKITG